MPDWLIKLARRIGALSYGHRYAIILTLGKEPDWSVQDWGKVEK